MGNSGNWSDYTNHWSATSNGAPGASKPTAADSVYFNANSVQAGGHTITVNEDTYCLDMIWTGIVNNPTFEMGTYNLNIYGSATFVAGVTVSPTSSTIVMSGASKTFAGVSKVYHDIYFAGTGTIVTGNNTFVNMGFIGGTSTTFTSNSTQQCESLSGDGSNALSTGYVKLKSSSTTRCTITCLFSNTREYWALQYVNIEGGGVQTINKAPVNDTLGDNTGWTINYLEASRYWVGGTGNWNTTLTANWDDVYGNQAPAPTALDDVYFDVSSFTAGSQTVTLTSNVTCKSMQWDITNAPTFSLLTRTLTVSGDITFCADMTVTCGTSTIILTGNDSTFDGAGYTFYKVNFTNSGFECQINGSNTFTELFLAENIMCIFEAGSTQTVTRIGAIGTLGNLTYLVSSVTDTHYNLVKSSGEVTFDYCDIKDCYASGGATFNAYNSTNSGGNSGITWITPGSGGEGGDGNPVYGRFYIALAHTGNATTSKNYWSETSGGVTGAALPTSADNVYFDENSYSGAHYHVDFATMSCNNLNFTNCGDLLLTSPTTTAYTVSIFGNLILDADIDTSSQYAPIFSMKATSGTKTMTSNGCILEQIFYIDGVGGTFTLTDEFNSTSAVLIKNGTFNTGNQIMNTGSFNSSYTSARTINMGSSTLTCTTIVFTDPTLLTFNAGTSTIIVTSTSFYGGGKTFNNVELTPSTTVTITGDNFYADLKLTISTVTRNFVFTAGSVQTFSTLSGDGISGTALVNVYSSSAGTHANFASSSATTVNRVYWQIKDNYASGATFNATKSFDVSGNSGWNITGLPTTRYWIGGSDIWDTTSTVQWSETSGGVGGAPVPTALDDVYFDANSFLAPDLWVRFDDGDIYCKDLSFAGVANNPVYVIRSQTGNLYISGNVTFDANIEFSDIRDGYNYRFHMIEDNKTFNGGGKSFCTLCIEGDNTTIIGNNTFADLNFEGIAKTVNITAGSTQTTTRLGVLGTVDNIITIQSTSAGAHYHISCPIMATFNYCSIQDCTAIGGATFTAYNSTNVSNNTNITFLAGSPDLTSGLHYVGVCYLIGASYTGDYNCWSSVKGGSAAMGLRPSSITNVYFDEGSLTENETSFHFNYVNAMDCKDFDCSNINYNITSFHLYVDINIYGNFIGSSKILLVYSITTGDLVFKATSAKTIMTNGMLLTESTFDGIGGKWTLQDNFVCQSDTDGTFTVTNGEIDLNGYNLQVRNSPSFAAGTTLTMGSGSLNIGSGLSFVNNPTFNCGTGTITFQYIAGTLAGNGYTFYDVVFNQSTGTTITGDNTFHDIKINAGKTCKVTSGSVQTISSLSGTGVSGSLSTLAAVTAGAHFHLTSTAAEIEANWYSIKDCTADGGASFYAYNSTNVSGNTGWNWGTLRYWVGQDGSWTDNTWALTSGGAAGASAPTALTHVYFDANSFNAGGQTIALAGAVVCRSLNFTGVTNTPTLTSSGASSINISGDLTLVAGMTVNNTGFTGYWNLISVIRNRKITSAGKTLMNLLIDGNAGSFQLQDNLTLSGVFSCNDGDVDLNGKTLTCTDFTFADSALARYLTMGAATINASGDVNIATDSELTFTPNTSTIVMTGNTKTFAGNGRTYYKLELQGTPIIITGDNTFTELKLTADKTTQFTNGSIQTIGSLSGDGTSGHLITMESTSGGNFYSIVKTTGTENVSYYSIKDSHASGGAIFYAMGSTDAGGNDGWLFLNATLGNANAEFRQPAILAYDGDGGGSGTVISEDGYVAVYMTRMYSRSRFRNPGINVYNSDGSGTGSGSETEEDDGSTSVNISPIKMNASTEFLNPEIIVLLEGEVRIFHILSNALCDFPIPTLIVNVDIQTPLSNSMAYFLIPTMFENVQINAPFANSNAEFLLPIVYDGHNINLPIGLANATSEFLEPTIEMFFHYESVNFLLDVKGNSVSLFLVPLITV